MSFAEIRTKAKKLNNYEKDATGASALWPSTILYKAECPAGKRWFLIGGVVQRDVSGTLEIMIKDSSDDPIAYLASEAAATTFIGYPEYSMGRGNWILDAGEYVSMAFGAAQDVNAYASCVVLEVSI